LFSSLFRRFHYRPLRYHFRRFFFFFSSLFAFISFSASLFISLRQTPLRFLPSLYAEFSSYLITLSSPFRFDDFRQMTCQALLSPQRLPLRHRYATPLFFFDMLAALPITDGFFTAVISIIRPRCDFRHFRHFHITAFAYSTPLIIFAAAFMFSAIAAADADFRT
jgi:hypothetical protein